MKLYHETIETQVNALEPRSYYIPFSEESFSFDLTKSNEVTLLSKWNFKYFNNFNESVIFENPTKEYDVPFMWQLKGFDYNQYTNFFYPFPFNPPYIDKDNPCGLYTTEYFTEELNRKHYIVFDGVDSCFYLFVNEKFVGFSTVSHSEAEFDISQYLVKGYNLIRVVVLKWCFGSYFEDQDKLRMSGIFREVYILNRPINHLKDYKITTSYDNSNGFININLDKESIVKLYEKDKLIDEQKGLDIIFKISDRKLWSAEEPNIYRLVIISNGEYIEELVGIRKIEIKNSIFYLNDVPIKFKGVNRHSMTDEGYVETYELMMKDIKMFKEYNINSVRTSHYPPHPLFTKLCDIYGVYVLEEADLESHGLETIHYYGDAHNTDNFANTKEYEHIYIHRAKRMYERDKNRQCVVMWSMGNEAGWGINFIETSKYLHNVDSRPIHYEGNTTRLYPEVSFRNPEVLDVYSMMYTNPKGCNERVKSNLDKPFMLCEYSHAMGNSCGDLKEYWDYIYDDDRFIGGFIWEWTNHSVKIDDNKYIFGGDFNEVEPPSRYDGNFCVDGLVDTSRRPHPSLGEVKQVYAPIDVKYTNDKYYIINHYDFLNLNNVTCLVKVEENGVVIKEFDLSLEGIEPHKEKEYILEINKKNYTTVNFFFYKNGIEISKRQIILSNKYDIDLSNVKANEIIKENDKFIVETENYKAIIGPDGMIENINELFKNSMRFSFDREPIDNDLPLKEEWQRLRIPYIRSRVREAKIKNNTLSIKGQITPDIVEPLYDFELIYSFYKDNINISVKAYKHEYVTNIARFGFMFILEDKFKNVLYFGRGEDESYIDRKMNTLVSLYKGNRDTMCFMYQKTQHSGSHVDSRMVKVFDDKNEFLIYSPNDFSFQVTPYEIKDVKRHDFEMNLNTGKTIVHIDYKNTGVGSAACGAPLEKEYEVNEKEIYFNFSIKI